MSNSTSLYLDFQIDSESSARAGSALAAALDAAPIESVLLRTANDIDLDAALTRTLIAFAQKKGVAVLLASDTNNAAKVGADGIHLPWSADIVRTFKTLRQSSPAILIGADAGRSRHDAMELGEAGADYVAFGITPHVEDREKAAARQRDLVEWWSEVFEIPCVAFDVPDEEAAHALAARGADFISVGVSSSTPENEAAARVRAFADAVRIPEPAK